MSAARVCLSRHVRRLAILWLAVLAAALAPSAALAQTPPPPVRSTVDENGVDLTSGQIVVGQTDVAIGPANHHGLSLSRQWVDNGWRYAEVPTASGSSGLVTVTFLGQSVAFHYNASGLLEPYLPNGANLAVSGVNTTFTASDGTVIAFTQNGSDLLGMASNVGVPTSVTFPDGVVWTYNYVTYSYSVQAQVPQECTDPVLIQYYSQWDPNFAAFCYYYSSQQQTYSYTRLGSITSSTGFQIKPFYQSDAPSPSTVGAWLTLTQAKAINNAVEYCSPTAPCSPSNSWPTASYTATSVTDSGGGTTNYTISGGEITGIQPPGASANTVTIGYTGGNVSNVQRAGVSAPWIYLIGTTSSSVTDPFSHTRTISYNALDGVTSDTNELGQVTTASFCGASEANCPEGLTKTVTAPEGNSVTMAYDARGNVTGTTRTPKPGSGLPALTTYASYDPCTGSNQKICNKPVTTTDARVQVTYFNWNAANGALNSVTAPWDANGVRPETRTTYVNVNAVYLSGPGTWTNGPAISVPGIVSSCRTAVWGNASSCVGTAEERLTVIAYPTSGANNAQPVSVTTRAGDNSLVATTTVSYDSRGRPAAVDGPQSGTVDQTVSFYRDDGKLGWAIGPDPDSAGAAKYPAVNYSYNPDGQVAFVQQGTVDNQTSSAWSTWAELSRNITSYDGYLRPVRAVLAGLSVAAYQVTDVIYDAGSRPLCTIQRMDPAYWSALATSCAPPQANDRVTVNHYDWLGRVDQVVTGYGTAAEAIEVTRTFYLNGQLQTLTDADGNRTTYAYDGHDRLTTTYFPSPTTHNLSSSTDYTQAGYDANGNVVSLRTRAGETLYMGYDNLNRMIVKYVPERAGLSSTHTRDVYYAYDLFGDLTLAAFDGLSGGDKVANSYNALGQPTGSTTAMDGVSRSLVYQYDPYGNFSLMWYPDSHQVTYHRHESGAFYYATVDGSPVFHATRDAAGRVNALYRWYAGWGTGTGFAYDSASRLSGLWQGFPQSSYNTWTTFTYNGASQITSRTRDNDYFAYTGQSSQNVTADYDANGLNEYYQWANSAGSTATYASDANGNFSSVIVSPTVAVNFIYDVENRLVGRTQTGGSTSTLRYDPLGRLYETGSTTTATTRFLYDGGALVAEYNAAGDLLRRYVHGDSSGDDPLVWFEGSGVTDAARHYLYADERGSIVASTDSAGNVTQTYRYDEYGVTSDVNASRFLYTGQAYIREVGMYYYKARFYSPGLARFMQTDPIGYGDGMNMYGYVGGDPVNGVDPTGSDTHCINNWIDTFVLTQNGWSQNGHFWDGQMCFAVPDITGPQYYDGPSGGGGGSSSPADSCALTNDQRRFFDQNLTAITLAAHKIHVSPTLLLGLAGHESGWGTSGIYARQNNPFGATPSGDSVAGEVAFKDLNEAWSWWATTFGPRVEGLRGNAAAFIIALEQDNRTNPSAVDQRGAYNSQTPDWPVEVYNAIQTARRFQDQYLAQCP